MAADRRRHGDDVESKVVRQATLQHRVKISPRGMRRRKHRNASNRAGVKDFLATAVGSRRRRYRLAAVVVAATRTYQ